MQAIDQSSRHTPQPHTSVIPNNTLFRLPQVLRSMIKYFISSTAKHVFGFYSLRIPS